jgi:hypothetical protein
MSATNYTPIQLYRSTTALAVPLAANLAAGELALNIVDGKLYYNDSGTVKLLASNASTTVVNTISFGTTGLTPSTATSGAVTVAGTLVVGNGGTGLTTITAGRILYGAGTSALGNSASLFWDSANSRFGVNTATPAVTPSWWVRMRILIPKGTTGQRPTGRQAICGSTPRQASLRATTALHGHRWVARQSATTPRTTTQTSTPCLRRQLLVLPRRCTPQTPSSCTSLLLANCKQARWWQRMVCS